MKSYEPGFTARQIDTLNLMIKLRMQSDFASDDHKISYMKEVNEFMRLALSIGLVSADQYDKARKKVFTLS